MTNREIAENRANEIENKIIENLQTNHSFRVEAGAGAGKTYSLEKVIEWLDRNKKHEFNQKGQKVACITYTNAAVDVIKSRLSLGSFIQPSTIHTFAWNIMKQFQSSLILTANELQILQLSSNDPSETTIDKVKQINYTLGVRYFEDGIMYVSHDDLIRLFVKLLDHTKFRTILSKKYPIVLIDEYQDSFKSIMDQFIKYFIKEGVAPQFGLFGDSWQTIYASQGACGLVESERLVVIQKEANFRSQKVIVDALNKIRPELPQISASDKTDGRIIVITTNEFSKERISSGYYKDELQDDVLFSCINFVKEKLYHSWTGESKTLMLTHKMLAKQLGYPNTLNLLGDHLKNKSDEHFLFFQNKLEPIYNALEQKDTVLLFNALGVERYPIKTRQDKLRWRELGEKLKEAREKTIKDVLVVAHESRLIEIPQKIEYWMSESNKIEQQNLYHKRPITELYALSYKEMLNAIYFFQSETDFSTDHGVKGEEYDNVFFVIGRGWNDYKFDQQLYLKPQNGDISKEYERNRNLFYVCCSRPKKNLAILITVPVNIQFRTYLNDVFGQSNIVSFLTFKTISL